jgi:hypothetical protein
MTSPHEVAVIKLRMTLSDALKAVPNDVHPVHVVRAITDLLAAVIVESVTPEAVKFTLEKVTEILRYRAAYYSRDTAAAKQTGLFPSSQRETLQ